jgi:hypothetical protein
MIGFHSFIAVKRLINNDYAVPHLWNPIALRNPEDGGNVFSET